MTEKEQLEWCQQNHATVWFGNGYVKVKPQDFTSAIKGASLLHAIESIELFRRERKQVSEALESLKSLDKDKER